MSRMVRLPPDWLNRMGCPVRRSVTEVTRYPLSRSRTMSVRGRVTTWTYWVRAPGLTVMTPCAPSFQKPGCMPPYMEPPPSVPCNDSRIGGTQPAMKLLNASCCGGNLPLTMAVSAISDFIDEPALVMYRPVDRRRSTAESLPSNHHCPTVGSL